MRAHSVEQDSANNYGSIVFETLVNYSLHIYIYSIYIKTKIYTIYQLHCKHCLKDKISKITTPLRLRRNNHRITVLHNNLKQVYTSLHVENNKSRLLNNN